LCSSCQNDGRFYAGAIGRGVRRECRYLFGEGGGEGQVAHYDSHDGKMIKAEVGVSQNSICDITIFLFFPCLIRRWNIRGKKNTNTPLGQYNKKI